MDAGGGLRGKGRSTAVCDLCSGLTMAPWIYYRMTVW
jgi:hypothetical protein